VGLKNLVLACAVGNKHSEVIVKNRQRSLVFPSVRRLPTSIIPSDFFPYWWVLFPPRPTHTNHKIHLFPGALFSLPFLTMGIVWRSSAGYSAEVAATLPIHTAPSTCDDNSSASILPVESPRSVTSRMLDSSSLVSVNTHHCETMSVASSMPSSIRSSTNNDKIKKPSRRRRSFFGSGIKEDLDASTDQSSPSKGRRISILGSSSDQSPPESRSSESINKPPRRRSMFGSTAPDERLQQQQSPPKEEEEQRSNPRLRRRSMFGSAIPDEPIAPRRHQSHETQPKIKKPRRRSMFGSTPTDEPVKPAEEAKPARKEAFKASSDPAELFIASQLRRREALYNAIHQLHAEEPKPVAAPPVKKSRRRSMFGSTPEHAPEEKQHQKSVAAFLKEHEKKSSSRRRSIFGSSAPSEDGSSRASGSVSRASEASGGSKKKGRRRSMFGSTPTNHNEEQQNGSGRSSIVVTSTSTLGEQSIASSQPSSQDDSKSDGKRRLFNRRRRHSIISNSNNSNNEEKQEEQVTPKSSRLHAHTMVNNERLKCGLPPFSRNIVLDTVAKDMAFDLVESKGKSCGAVNFHANVGQGNSFREIHETMMTQEIPRGNILSRQFQEFGIGVAKGKGGTLYMCELFKE
jgi:uncharacterized protein YkwD